MRSGLQSIQSLICLVHLFSPQVNAAYTAPTDLTACPALEPVTALSTVGSQFPPPANGKPAQVSAVFNTGDLSLTTVGI